MGNVHKYAALKSVPGVTKTMKFKQSNLIRNAINDDILLDCICNVFTFYGIDAPTAQKYVTEIGACGVFSSRWLSEVLGVSYPEYLRDSGSSGQALAVAHSVMRNVFVKEKVSDVYSSLFRLHKLKQTGPRIEYGRNTLPLIMNRAGNYFVACLGHIEAHAIAFTNDFGGMFFDPNVGEYAFDISASRQAKSQFINKWLEICRDDFVHYTLFWAYPVGRAD